MLLILVELGTQLLYYKRQTVYNKAAGNPGGNRDFSKIDEFRP